MRTEAAQCELDGPRITGPIASLKILGGSGIRSREGSTIPWDLAWQPSQPSVSFELISNDTPQRVLSEVENVNDLYGTKADDFTWKPSTFNSPLSCRMIKEIFPSPFPNTSTVELAGPFWSEGSEGI